MAGTLGIAWRNLGRNRRRTIATGAALAIGTCLSVAAFGLTDGMDRGLLDTLTRLDLGHVQIHQPDFPRTRALAATIDDAPAALGEVRATDGVVAATPRVYAYALLGHGHESAGAQLVGVDPRTEPQVTRLDAQRTAGAYLTPEPTPWPRGRALTADERAADQRLTDAAAAEALGEIDALAPMGDGKAAPAAGPSPAATRADAAETRALALAQSPPPAHPPPAFIGASLARVLHASVGDLVHATGQTADGQSEEVDLRIVGIFRTGTVALDRGRVYVHVADLQRFVHLDGRVHEIAVLTPSPAHAAGVARALDARLAPRHLLVRDWSRIRPDIQQMLRLQEITAAVMIFIILFVATLGVVNTMLMAVFERTRELGVLRAIGMSGRRVITLIVTETTLLVLAASTIGTVLGLAIDLVLARWGIDLSMLTRGISFGGYGLRPVLYADVTIHGLVLPTAILAATCFLASFYPAVRAARLRPAVGLRET